MIDDLRALIYRYAQYGDVSPKIDVYAFGVVLYELISAKEAIIKINESITDSKGLVSMVNLNLLDSKLCIIIKYIRGLINSFIFLFSTDTV